MCTDDGEANGRAIDRSAGYAHLRDAGETTMRGKACDAITHDVERRDRLTFRRGWEGRCRQAKNGAVLQEMCETSADFSAHETSPCAIGCRNLRARDQVARHDE